MAFSLSYIGVPADATTVASAPAEVRVHLGFASDDIVSLSDTEANELMLRSQAAVERYTGLTLFTTTFTNLRDEFDRATMQLRKAPIQSITSIERLVDGVLTLVASTVFKLTRANQLFWGNAALRASQTWPNDQDIEDESIKVIFIAGFGAAGTDLPEDLRMGILRVAADLFANRGDCSCDQDVANISSGSRALLSRFRVPQY